MVYHTFAKVTRLNLIMSMVIICDVNKLKMDGL
ncbi:Uncharacterised protein [Serratia rubidaea]|uniref:Uncharacterized protein n=1 Tax=Serratia rubidaea TaxID=61652 RepID=A0A447QN67_SERRU|nr:Uncharacterised protein [Serratia rubidaea]